jgi:hypothetical protein
MDSVKIKSILSSSRFNMELFDIIHRRDEVTIDEVWSQNITFLTPKHGPVTDLEIKNKRILSCLIVVINSSI